MKMRKSSNVENIAYKFLAKPEECHKTDYFPRWFGCKRFLWNTMLADKRDFFHEMGFSLDNEVSDYKTDYPFLKDVDSLVLANTKLSLDKAYKAFFKGDAAYPNFKKRTSRQSFTTNIASHGATNLYYNKDQLPYPKSRMAVTTHRYCMNTLKPYIPPV